MELRYTGSGTILSHYPSAGAIPLGCGVVLNSSEAWALSGDNVRPSGLALVNARAISAGIDIFNSAYDTGETVSGGYNGRRNVNRQDYANVGEPLPVLIGAGNIIEEFDQFTGNVSALAYLTSGASGVLKAEAAPDTYASRIFARVIKGGNKASAETLTIQTL